MTCSHWLVAQSVTSYINLQGIPLGVFHCLVIQVSTPLCKQYHVLLVAALPREITQVEQTCPLTFHSTALEPAQPLSRGGLEHPIKRVI